MRVLRIAWTEVRRLGNGRARWTAVVALALIPLLYGATYIDANWDPQGGFGRVPAAVVVEDSATTAPDGTRIDAGPTIAAELVRSRVFSWIGWTRRPPDAASPTGGTRPRSPFRPASPRP